MVLRLRELTAEERSRIERLAHSRTAPARRVERARIIWHASQGQSAPAIAAQFGLDADTARGWIRLFSDNHADQRRQPTWPAASAGGRA
jgi:transposase